MAGHNKVTFLEKEDNIRKMISFILTVSNRRGDIIRYFTQKWNKKPDTIDGYIALARHEIMKTTYEDKQYQKAECLSQINEAIYKSYRRHDFKTALTAIKLKMDLQGLAEPVRIDLDNNVVDSADRKNIIDKLQKIADSRDISLAELCTREGIDIERYQEYL